MVQHKDTNSMYMYKKEKDLTATYHGIQHLLMIPFITNTIPPIISTSLAQQPKIIHTKILHKELLLFRLSRTAQKLIKHVIIPLIHGGMDQSNFFQQIRFNTRTSQFSCGCKPYVNVFPKP